MDFRRCITGITDDISVDTGLERVVVCSCNSASSRLEGGEVH